jgi:hypothetical protein
MPSADEHDVTPDIQSVGPLHWRYVDQYGGEVLCAAAAPRPVVFRTVYEAVATSRRLGGCSLGRCLHAPMRWVLLRPREVE